MRRFARFGFLLALILGGVWLLIPPQPLQTVTVPDGEMVLEGVSYGLPAEVIPPGPPWQRLLRRFNAQARGIAGRGSSGVPPSVRASYTYPSDEPVLVFWWRARFPREWQSVHPGLFHFPEAIIFDEDGCEAAVRRSFQRFSDDVPKRLRANYDVHSALRFPRHGATVGIRLISRQRDGSIILGPDLRIPNPVPGPYPVWTSEPLPVIRRVGDLEFSLVEFRRLPDEEAGYDGWRHQGRGYESWYDDRTRLRVETYRNGQRLPDWGLVHLRITDASGNHWEWLDLPPATQPLNPAVAHTVALWAGEPAWKLTVHMARNFTADFAPDELYTLHAVPLPLGNVNTLPIDASIEHSDGVVTVRSLSWWKSGDYRAPDESLPFDLNVDVHTEREDLHVTLVKAVDDQGRPADVSPLSAWLGDRTNTRIGRLPTSSASWTYEMSIMPQAGARSLDLTLAIHRTHTVEFLAALTPGTENER